jgi:hypothetical protein
MEPSKKGKEGKGKRDRTVKREWGGQLQPPFSA